MARGDREYPVIHSRAEQPARDLVRLPDRPGESVALSIFTSACISLDRTLPIDRSPIVGRTCRRRATSTLFRVLARVTCAACHALAYWRTVVLAACGSMYCEVTMLAVVSSSQRLASTLRAKLRVF